MTSPASPAADRVTLTCQTCGHTAEASASLAQHRLACPNCGQALPIGGRPAPSPTPDATTGPAATRPVDEPATSTGDAASRRSAGLPGPVVAAAAVVILAGIAGVAYWVISQPEPPPPSDPEFKYTAPVPVRKDFGAPLPPAPAGRMKGLNPPEPPTGPPG